MGPIDVRRPGFLGDALPFWIAGQAESSDSTFTVEHPYGPRQVATVCMPTPEQVERAVAAAATSATAAAALPAYARADALRHLAQRLTERREEAAELIVAESGKPLRWADVEVTRAISTLTWAAEEARRWSGDLQRLDTEPASTGRIAMIRRYPRGPVLAIAPFNFPLNLMVHKLAPALAVGAPIILKPAPATPLTALLLGELLAETELPVGMWSVLTLPNDRMPQLVADPRLPVVSFTGSGLVGWSIRDAVPRKHVTLELGGNAAAVVCADYSSDRDLDWAAERIARFANYQAGQSCISVQRVYAHESLHDLLLTRVLDQVGRLQCGDPRDASTEVGPMIDETAARRVEEWVDQAVTAGAKLLTGGGRDGASYEPTVLVDVPPDAKVLTEEVFGPVLVFAKFDEVSSAFELVNNSRFGLQTGVFTHDLATAFRAGSDLEVGGVVIGDVPSYRADQMPYGGVKDSGLGREGIAAAMHDLTYERVLVLTGIEL
jgi:acyl-CoA reductase-like NAD-dependent aldehyde dehydrogenase